MNSLLSNLLLLANRMESEIIVISLSHLISQKEQQKVLSSDLSATIALDHSGVFVFSMTRRRYRFSVTRKQELK